MTSDLELIQRLSDAAAAGTPVALATIVSTRRSVPRHAGTKMLVFADGSQVGTVGGGAMESRVIEEALAALRTGAPKLVNYELVDPDRGDPGVCGGEAQIYLEPYMPPATILIVGAGHVGRAVAELAHWLGYRVVLTDDRSEQLEGDDLPKVDAVHGSVADAIEQHPVDDQTSVVVVSRDVDIDVEAVGLLLATPVRYLGVMGSARRWKIVRERLIDSGVDGAVLDERVHVPIGIDLGAETVEEIAVSILSEVIRVARSGAESGI